MTEHVAGQPAPTTRRRWWLPPREEIGNPDCPLMHRWTLLRIVGRKLLMHHFLPDAEDIDCHDHPSPFVTLVCAGGYLDVGPAGERDVLRAGGVRYRPAEHAHRTLVGPRGCWTVVVMGRKRRDWGFWRGGRWWQWRAYEQAFGLAMRCDPEKPGRPRG